MARISRERSRGPSSSPRLASASALRASADELLATPLPQGERGTPAQTEKSQSPDSTQKRICVGKIGAAHGVRGDVKLWSYTTDPLAIADYAPLETADGKRRLEIETLRAQGVFLVAHLKGVGDRDAAEKLRNLELYASREKLPAIEASGEFYVADLIGLAACDTSGAPLGEIVGVHNFGAGDLIELKLPGSSDTLLLPFSDATVPAVDIAEGKVTVELPGGIQAGSEQGN